MSCIWTTENFVSLFCNLDAVLHLLLPPVRFLCQSGTFESLSDLHLVWPPKLGAVCTDKPQTSHKAGLSSSVHQLWNLGMGEEPGSPYPPGFFSQGEKAEKGFLELYIWFKGFSQLRLCTGIRSLRFLLEFQICSGSRAVVRPAGHIPPHEVHKWGCCGQQGHLGHPWGLVAGRVHRWQTSTNPQELSVPSWGPSAGSPQQDWHGAGRGWFFFRPSRNVWYNRWELGLTGFSIFCLRMLLAVT